ncbi:MAG: hypothetical protein FWE43_01095 [Streptococcaceae bacterium]|nr:hypothetical protein [Streptococcaceae bacterium]MCL2681073.1 hypothetical protein [Streptococcaceae bacterium]
MWTSNSKKEIRVAFGMLRTSQIVKGMVQKSHQGTRNFTLAIGSGYAGTYEVSFGKLGDVINLTDGIIVSAKKFQEIYKIIEDRSLIVKDKQGLTDRQNKHWQSLTSLLENKTLNFDERRPLFLAYNSIESGQNFGDTMRKLIADLENVKIAQKNSINLTINNFLSDIKSDYEY